MSHIHAKTRALHQLQQALEETPGPLAAEAVRCEELIEDTLRKLARAIDAAREAHRYAQAALENAVQALEQAQQTVEQLNSSRDPDTPPHTVSDYYFEALTRCSDRCDDTRDRLERAFDNESDFRAYARQHRERQEAALAEYRALLAGSRDYVETYTHTLWQAFTRVSGQGASAGAGEGGAAGAGGGEAAGARALTDEEVAAVAQATGWLGYTIRRKCRMGADGVLHYKTINQHLEGKTHPSGVPYRRGRVTIGGLTVEGVFPVFTPAYEPPIMPPALQQASGAKYTEQFDYCNRSLARAVAAGQVPGDAFSPLQLAQIAKGLTPAGYTWHHHEEPGRMQLVRKKAHNPAMGGAGHTCGALWCG